MFLSQLTHLLNRLTPSSSQRLVQPVPDVSLDDVERIVRRDFPAERVAALLALLRDSEANSGISPRVQLAALKLAAGSEHKLDLHLEAAKSDYRNLLVAAEYPEYGRIGLRIQKMRANEKREIIERDWRHYEEWLRK
jgi:hypothetical protein